MNRASASLGGRFAAAGAQGRAARRMPQTCRALLVLLIAASGFVAALHGQSVDERPAGDKTLPLASEDR